MPDASCISHFSLGIFHCDVSDRPDHAGLRHLALSVHDLDAMKRFYVDLLGFAIEWEPDADNVYLTSGTDNLALHRSPDMVIPIEDDATTRPPPGGALDHLGLIVRTADDVDRWAAFLESRGVAIVATPRTHRDGARSCYFRDPDGNSVQIIHHPPISGKI
jgi:catechol 2,3-dioxygenase-like lactoylglutathione lyase family enzyme